MIKAIIWDCFGVLTDGTKNTPLLEYIATLKPRYKIGLISNVGSNWIRDEFLTADEQKLFDDMVLSYEVGLTKPDPNMFLLVAQRLGVTPQECVLVDDIEGYCAVAKEQGMQAVVYKNFTQLHTDLEKLLSQSE